MPITTDPNNPDLGHGVDNEPIEQNNVYLVLSDDERAKGFIRPLRFSYMHKTCRYVTSMSQPIAETYARDPEFYGSTYCTQCKMHRPVSEFVWMPDGTTVGS